MLANTVCPSIEPVAKFRKRKSSLGMYVDDFPFSSTE